MTIAAEIISGVPGSPDLSLGRDWLDRQTDATVRIVSVDRHEVNGIAMDTCVQLSEPSAVLVIMDSEAVGGDTMASKKEKGMRVRNGPEVLHNRKSSEIGEGIWSRLAVLKSDWRDFVVCEQQEIEAQTDEINNWTVHEGSRLVRFITNQQYPGITPEQRQTIDASLIAAAQDPRLTPRSRQRLTAFYAEFAEKTHELRKRVSALRNNLRLGLEGEGNSEEPAKRVLLKKNGSDHSGSHNNMGPEELGLIQSNEVRTDGPQKGSRRGNNSHSNHKETGVNCQTQPLAAPPIYRSTDAKDNERLKSIKEARRKGLERTLEDPKFVPTAGYKTLPAPQILEAPADSVQFFEALDSVDKHRQELMKFEALIRARKIGLDMDAQKLERLTGPDPKQPVPPERIQNIGSSLEGMADNLGAESGHGSYLELENFLMATRRIGDIYSEPGKAEIVPLKSLRREPRATVPCFLEAQSSAEKEKAKFTELEREQIQMNLATRNKALKASRSFINNGVKEAEGQNQAPTKSDQTMSEPMADKSDGCAPAITLPPATVAGNASGWRLDQVRSHHYYSSAYFVDVDAENHANHISLQSITRMTRSITGDSYTPDGGNYNEIYVTVRTNPLTDNEIVVSTLVATSVYDLFGVAGEKTVIFRALKIGRQYRIGEGAEYKAGLLICMGNAADGFGEQISVSIKNLGLQKSDHIIQPNHQLYKEIHECLEQLKHDLELDAHLGPNLYDYAQPLDEGLFGMVSEGATGPIDTRQLPKVQLDTNLVQLYDLTRPFPPELRRHLRKEVPNLIRREQELAFGPVVTAPGPNYHIQLASELARRCFMVSEKSRTEAHFRQPMRASRDGLKHYTQNLRLVDQEAFITLVTVQVHLHGIDATQTYPEQLNVTAPFSHLDQLLRLTFEPVPKGEFVEPNYLEREFQYSAEHLLSLQPRERPETAGIAYRPAPEVERYLAKQASNPVVHVTAINRTQTHTLILNNPDDFDRRPRNAAWAPDPYRAHLADLMAKLPFSTMICIRTPSTRRNAAITLNREWEKLPKICQDTVSARGTSCVRSAGYNPYVTDFLRYNVDNSISKEIPGIDDSNYIDPQHYALARLPNDYCLRQVIPSLASGTEIARSTVDPDPAIVTEVASFIDEYAGIFPTSTKAPSSVPATTDAPVNPANHSEARRNTDQGVRERIGSAEGRDSNPGLDVAARDLTERRPKANSLPNPFARLSLDADHTTSGQQASLQSNRSSKKEKYKSKR
ncbi:hypothetical protein C8J56DRAFT_889733 [Mycena floridula]|nr:hypothetical protein C8J56DRAFT_889733 [Mycena floridula]